MGTVLFAFMISLLLLHEMDAIRTKEWKMFVILQSMAEEKAYRVFTLLHLPLYVAVILAIAAGDTSVNLPLYYIIDFFLIGHGIIHYGFRNHKDNGFASGFSKWMIYSMSILALVHLCVLFLS